MNCLISAVSPRQSTGWRTEISSRRLVHRPVIGATMRSGENGSPHDPNQSRDSGINDSSVSLDISVSACGNSDDDIARNYDEDDVTIDPVTDEDEGIKTYDAIHESDDDVTSHKSGHNISRG